MKQELLNLYNKFKTEFIEEMMKDVPKKEINFSPYIRLQCNEDTDEFFVDIVCLSYDSKEGVWYVHNFVTNTDLSTDEYWTPLDQMSMDELFKIEENLK